jgi:polyribonucleotide nucleotidyltransferase
MRIRRPCLAAQDVDKDDAAFVLGRGGATKRKVARVSGAEIELDEKTLTVTVQGSKSQCSKAEDYINFIRQQRVGPVAIDATEVRDDFTAYPVPSDCIGAQPRLF